MYTGTHDNETLKGWLDSIKSEEIEMIQKYIGRKVEDKSELVDEVIRMAQASTANTCIIPMQDYLHLDNKARMNTPSTLGVTGAGVQNPHKITKKIIQYNKRIKQLI